MIEVNGGFESASVRVHFDLEGRLFMEVEEKSDGAVAVVITRAIFVGRAGLHKTKDPAGPMVELLFTSKHSFNLFQDALEAAGKKIKPRPAVKPKQPEQMGLGHE